MARPSSIAFSAGAPWPTITCPPIITYPLLWMAPPSPKMGFGWHCRAPWRAQHCRWPRQPTSAWPSACFAWPMEDALERARRKGGRGHRRRRRRPSCVRASAVRRSHSCRCTWPWGCRPQGWRAGAGTSRPPPLLIHGGNDSLRARPARAVCCTRARWSDLASCSCQAFGRRGTGRCSLAAIRSTCCVRSSRLSDARGCGPSSAPGACSM